MKKENRFDRRWFMKLAALQTVSVVAGCATVEKKSKPKTGLAQNADNKPNVVLIVSDDHRWDLMSCAGNK